MGVEVAVSNLPKINEEGNVKLLDKENGKLIGSEPITFGSHGINEQHFPKDAVEEWPEPQVHYFWFVKHRSYEDPSLKAKIDQAEREIQTMNRRRSQIIESIKPKQSARSELVATLRSLGSESSKYWTAINERRQEMKPLQDALGTLRGSGKGVGICSSEEELNKFIRSLEYQIQHESLTLKEEKQLMREIKDLEATRPKVIANSAMRAKIEESLGQKDALHDQVKLMGTDLDGVRKQKEEIKAKMDQLGDQLKALNNQINPLQQELEAVTNKRDEAFESIRDLRKKRDEGNKLAYENRAIINTARDVAARKDVKALEEYVEAEVEKFMSLWNSSKGFRDDYEKRILPSLDMKQLSRDGRMRNPGEKPLVAVAEPPRRETPVVPKVTPKAPKEDPKVTPVVENLPEPKVEKEAKKKSTDSKPALEQAKEEDDVFVVEKTKREVSNINSRIDEAKLKEMKKEEEKEKQRQALERKKKLQEKAAAKASLRAQKEAEKKQKERERKLKKKEVTSSGPVTSEEEPTDKETEAVEPENPDNLEDVAETLIPKKGKVQKEASLKYRKAAKPRGALPKAIIKKKKSNDYLIWGAASAVVIVMLLALGYNYVF